MIYIVIQAKLGQLASIGLSSARRGVFLGGGRNRASRYAATCSGLSPTTDPSMTSDGFSPTLTESRDKQGDDMRLQHCVICGIALPEGGRIDRRSCREACRVMAYRQRRKRDAPGSSPSLTPSPDAGQVHHRVSARFCALSDCDRCAHRRSRLRQLARLAASPAQRPA